MARKILNPRFIDEDKQQINCQFDYGDRIVDVTITRPREGGEPNADWTEIMDTFGEEKLIKEFEIGLKEHRKRQKEQRDREEERRTREQSEMLFNHKIKLFEIPEVQNSKNRKMKSKIRKAETPEAAQTYANALVAMELMAELEADK